MHEVPTAQLSADTAEGWTPTIVVVGRGDSEAVAECEI